MCQEEKISWLAAIKKRRKRSSPEPMTPQTTSVQYLQLLPRVTGASQAIKKHCPSLTKLSTDLPTLSVTRVLHLPIDNTQAAWLNHFLMNTNIPSDVCLKHQECGVEQAAPQGLSVSHGMSHNCLLLQGFSPRPWTWPWLMPIVTTPCWGSGASG